MFGIRRLATGCAVEGVPEVSKFVSREPGDENHVGWIVDAERGSRRQTLRDSPTPQMFSSARMGGLGSRCFADAIVALENHASRARGPRARRLRSPRMRVRFDPLMFVATSLPPPADRRVCPPCLLPHKVAGVGHPGMMAKPFVRYRLGIEQSKLMRRRYVLATSSLAITGA